MVIIEKIVQFFSFIRIRRKYGKFNVKDDKDLPFDEFRQKYLALAEHPDWIEWALKDQTLEGFSDQVEKFFFLCMEFPSIFNLKTKINNKTPIAMAAINDKFTFESLTTLSNMLVKKMYSFGNLIPLRYQKNELNISEEDFATLVLESIKNNNFSMFSYLYIKYNTIKLYEGSNIAHCIEEKIRAYQNYKNSSGKLPWFSSVFAGKIIPKINFSTYVDENNFHDLYPAIKYKYANIEFLYNNLPRQQEAVNIALYHAAREGNVEAVKYLLAKDKEIDIDLFYDKYGYKRKGIVRSCFELIEAKRQANFLLTRVNSQDEFTGDTALHAAVDKNNVFAIRVLCENNADIFKVNKKGLSALDLALQEGHQESFNALMSFVDKNIVHAREKWSCKMTWQCLISHLYSYLKSFPKEKTKQTIEFIIQYFFIPFSNNFKNIQMSIYYYHFLSNKIDFIENLEEMEDFKQLSLSQKIIKIATQCRNDSAYVARMKILDPDMYAFMIDDGFYSTCCISGEEDLDDKNEEYVEKNLKREDFIARYSKVLNRLQKNITVEDKQKNISIKMR
jgi:hypothetical protein